MADKSVIWNKTQGRCWYCGALLTPSMQRARATHPEPREFVIDHVIPKAKGGSEEIGNLVPCCYSCNATKGRKDVEDFREWQRRLANRAPRFSEEQIYYLSENGVRIPELSEYKFYFEKEGLK